MKELHVQPTNLIAATVSHEDKIKYDYLLLDVGVTNTRMIKSLIHAVTNNTDLAKKLISDYDYSMKVKQAAYYKLKGE